ncbi:hypothetical protein WA026_016406 [Henosepilachna vigintioctopunctata]|uniref:DNA replication ATP-dependent helicase/nuclease n=1 Tax=Henosepilachna vigintioctopunctata TaxID=420089 RepID=A0AAW1UNI4_9CUCU
MKKQSKKATKNQNNNPLKISDFFKKVEEENNTKRGSVSKAVLSSSKTNTTASPAIEGDSDVEIISADKSESNNETFTSMKRKKNCDFSNVNTELQLNKKKCVLAVPSTSEKRSPLKEIELLSPRKTNISRTPEKVNSNRTPTKTTPAKLFQKTPQKVSDFNVEIIQNFLKLTPSKSSLCSDNICSPVSSGQIQTSLLDYISPSTSNRSVEAQKFNEITPKKNTSVSCSNTPTTRVKMKLNFGEKHVQVSNSKDESRNNLICSNDKDICNTISKEKQKEDKVCGSDQEIADMINQNSLDEFCLSQFIDGFEEDFLGSADKLVTSKNTLDFTNSKHCKVVKLEILPSQWKVTVKSTSSEEYGICNLREFWLNTKLNIGDTIHITAKKIDSEWIIDNNNGLIVFEPDLLISSTSVVNSLFCKRKNVLSEKFHGFEPANEFMIVGTLVHYILQETLRKKLYTIDQIKEVLELTLKEKATIRRMYESGQSVEELREKVSNYIPRILEFVEYYLKDNKKKVRKQSSSQNNWQGFIDSVEDIEENIWCPELGIKGKVDVSIKSKNQRIPLELKTGKSSFSLEHKGQVLLYIMMMNKLGHNVSSGLLMYLKDGIIKEIPMMENEKRDIMILRNELAYYLKRRPKVISPHGDKKEKYICPPELPEPINHRNACRSCPYNVICSSFSQYNKDDLSTNKSFSKVREEMLSHLEEQHLNYFIHWSSLINLEEVECNSSSKLVQEIYRRSPKQREADGRCLSFLKITEVSDECSGMMDHTFTKDDTSFNFFSSGICEGNYTVISTDNRPAVASGFVMQINAHSITIALDRNLKKKHPLEQFHIDTYESANSHSFNQTSLTLLLESSPRADQLRRIIIDKLPPTFLDKLPKVVASKGIPILKRLNKVQQRAVLKAIAANDFLLIKGMPGTGKTSTIVALIQLLTELGKSVLLTSHTHSAVDNVCEKLLKLNVDFLRLGTQARISDSLGLHSEHYRTKDCKTPEELMDVYNKVNVIATTCLGSKHPVLSKRILDVCIVDESTQVLQTTLIRPLYAAKAFILIGDPEQLPPVIRNKEAQMNKTITRLANAVTYNGDLLVANDSIGRATLNITDKKAFSTCFMESKWISSALNTDLENSVHVIDTGPTWDLDYEVAWILKNTNDEERKSSLLNIFEAAVVANLIDTLLKGGIKPNDIGVIAAFTCQVKQISFLLDKNIDVSTVDQFQGRDKNVIIYSCSKSLNLNKISTESKFGILDDHRRLTVAITRAKHKLIIVCDMNTMRRHKPFSKLFDSIGKSHVTTLKENEDKFCWSSVLKNVKS